MSAFCPAALDHKQSKFRTVFKSLCVIILERFWYPNYAEWKLTESVPSKLLKKS